MVYYGTASMQSSYHDHEIVDVTCHRNLTSMSQVLQICVYIYMYRHILYTDVMSNIALISRKCFSLADGFKFTDTGP